MLGAALPLRAPSTSATVSLGVDAAGVIRHVQWHRPHVAGSELADRRLSEVVGPASRTDLLRLVLAAVTSAQRSRGLLEADLGAGVEPVALTVEDRLRDLSLLVVHLLRLSDAADELEALGELAFRDPLTGLANRALFEEHLRRELDRAHRMRRWPAVLSADVDGLKRVNDTLGHRGGDRLLAEVGRRLQESCRPFDVPARLSGDEFALLCPEVDNEFDAHQLAARVGAVVNGPAVIEGQDVEVRLAVGCAVASPDDVKDGGDDLRHRADLRMYAAKRRGAST